MFCAYFGLIAAPASTQTLCTYVAFLGRSFVSVTSVRNYVNGVKLWHLLQGLPFPPTPFPVKLTLRGLSKRLFHQAHQARAMGPQDLVIMWRVLQFHCPIDCTVYCMFVFAFFLMARKSTLFPPTRAQFSSSKYPCRGDVSFTPFGLLITLKYSKTNQFGFSNYSVPLVPLPSSPLCPVRAFSLMCARVPAPPSAPLFTFPSAGEYPPVTHAVFLSHLRRVLRQANIPPTTFTGHSFRRGGATWAFRAGVPGELIKSIGGWSSDAYLRYLDMSLSTKLRAANIIALSLQ
jgi:hypothetical protein